MFIVTIDSGTTNTRVRVWKNKKVIAEAGESVGLRDTARTGNRATLTAGVKLALDRALAQVEGCTVEQCVMVASGMITAEAGLCPIPHLHAPISLGELAQGAIACDIPEISPQPVWFIPGIKNAVTDVTADNLDAMDVMRGEEVETFGLLALHDIRGPALIVLPGSHSKFIRVDEQQRIISSATTMAGELLDVLTHQTILANSLDSQFATELDGEYLQKGAASCHEVGFARSCFSVRLLDLFTTASHNQKASYLLGATLCSDIQAMKHSRALNLTPDTPIYISGKAILTQALVALINADPFFTANVVLIDEDKHRPLSGVGAITVIEQRVGQLDACCPSNLRAVTQGN
ncbi:2-dehydro-3-deoxygalactonokinase [Budvicia diplopodorum]|uniref:2-dehydro-3-deoxygalactonokinase n=1 Tax=Budvicia diplopodorum TaxID=1119056 RepID=UPI0013576422|nr:2-dehydro-3-deoxygalactonokinase [Budvicia diplopodorum]